MNPIITLAVAGGCLAAFAILVIALWRSAAPEEFRWGKEKSEELVFAERDMLEVTRRVQTLVTVPLIGLLQRCLALDEGRVADRETDLRGVPDVVTCVAGEYFDALHCAPPLDRMSALEEELHILEIHLQRLMLADERFCPLRLLLEIAECRTKIGTQYWRTDAEAFQRACHIRETFLRLEDEIYELASLVKEREANLGFGGSDGAGLHDGEI